MNAALQRHRADRECVVMQPYHTELGAGTFNPATFLRCLGPEPWRTVYVEPCLRPTDGRYGENPYRFQQYYQLQVILKPAPEDILEQYFGSLDSGEITYGLERLAMFLQGKRSAFELEWAPGFTWGEVYRENERQWSTYNFEEAPVDILMRHFADYESECQRLLDHKLPLPAYDQALKASHMFNLLDARGAISVTERASYIGRVRDLARQVAQEYLAPAPV